MDDEKEGRYASARDGLNLMIQENPHDTSLLKMRANIELEDNHPELALVDIEEVINVTPADAEAYIMQGDILLSMKKKDEARKDYEQAIKHRTPCPELEERLRQCK